MNGPRDDLEPAVSADASVTGFKVLRSIPRWAGIGLFIYTSVYSLAYAQTFLVPVVLGFLLALVFSPIRRVADRRGVPSALTSFAIVLSLLMGFMTILGALSMPVTDWIERAPEISLQVRIKLSELSSGLGSVFDAAQRLDELTSPASDVERVAVDQTNYAVSVLTVAPGIIAQIVFTLVLLFFILASGDMIYEKIVHVIPRFEDKKRALQVAHAIERRLSQYLLTITIINAGLGAVIGTAMWILGMPSPLVFGVIAFIFNFVPYLGAVCGVVIAASVALVSFDWVWMAPIVGLTYFAATAIEGQFVTPYFVGRSLRLNTVVVFLSVSFWAWLWSAIGMVVAVPLLATLRIICANVDGLHGLGDFLSERHAEVEDGDEASQ